MLDDFSLALGLARGPSRILLVEDDLRSAGVIAAWLRGQGHDVDHRVGARLVEGELHGLNPDEPLAEYDAAILDYYFPGDFTGGSLATLFRHRRPGMPVVGISSVEDANRRMREAGAGWSVRKSRLVAAIEAVSGPD